MKTCVIFPSCSMNALSGAEHVSAACGGKHVGAGSEECSSRIAACTIGHCRAMKGMCDRIGPAAIGVPSEDIIVTNMPVRAGRATPAISAAVAALNGCRGKKALISATCGGKEKDTPPILKKDPRAGGVTVTGELASDRERGDDPGRVTAMAERNASCGT